WFDRWLKGVDNGVDGEPPLTWFHREPTPPERFPKRLNGSWRATGAWPSAGEQKRVLRLGDGFLTDGSDASSPSGPGAPSLPHGPTAGANGGSLCWGAGHPPNGLAAALRLEADAGATYSSHLLREPLDILGVPVAVLHVSTSQPVAHLVVRLGDVAPDGAIEQVSEGILNLTHRESHVQPIPL